MTEQVEPFLADSSLPPLSGQHLTEIATAGAAGPYRHWGINWPYFVSIVVEPILSVPLVWGFPTVYKVERPGFMLTKRHAQTQGEGGIDVAPEGASWRTKPATRHDLAIVASS
jgi:hypothetical protein